MSRYVPRTYNNRRLLRIIIGTIISTALAILILFVVLFFGLEELWLEWPYPEGDPVLQIPFLMENPPPRDEYREPSTIGFFIGAFFGAMQFLILSKFSEASASSKVSARTVFFVIFQFMLPFVVLLATTLLLPDGPLLVGVGMLTALLLLAVGEYIFRRSKHKKKKQQ